MKNKEAQIRWESMGNDCYDAKQAEYDYEGAIPQDEDRADWIKPQKVKVLG